MCSATVASIFIEGSRVSQQQHTDAGPSKNLALSHSLYVRSHVVLEVCTNHLLFLLLEMSHIIFGIGIFVVVQLPSAHRQRSLLPVLCVRYKSSLFVMLTRVRIRQQYKLVSLAKNLDNRTVLLFGMPVCMLFAS